jgi:hypothetical protein
VFFEKKKNVAKVKNQLSTYAIIVIITKNTCFMFIVKTVHTCNLNKTDAFNVKRVAGDGNCLLQSLAILLKNEKSQYNTERQETEM